MGDKASESVASELYRTIFVGAIAVTLLIQTCKKLYELWPRFSGQVETDVADGLAAGLEAAFPKRERGH